MNCAYYIRRIITLVAPYSVKKAHPRLISQYLKFQAILEFVSRQLISLFTFISQPLIYPKENNVPVWLLIYSQVV